MTQEEILKASVAYNERTGKLRVIGGDAILSQEEFLTFNKNLDFIAGAKWAFDYMEKNRLTACDNMTEEEVEREQRFVYRFLKDNDRTPTFSDCIEITRKETIDKACEYIRHDWCEMMVYDYNQFGGCTFNLKKTIDRFRKAMEEKS